MFTKLISDSVCRRQHFHVDGSVLKKLSKNLWYGLDQWCPTLSPIATCGDRDTFCRLLESNILIFLDIYCIKSTFKSKVVNKDPFKGFIICTAKTFKYFFRLIPSRNVYCDKCGDTDD